MKTTYPFASILYMRGQKRIFSLSSHCLLETLRGVSKGIILSFLVSDAFCGFLGIDYTEKKGAIVLTEIIGISPAADAGLKTGDVLMGYNGDKITDPDALIKTIRQLPANSICKFKVLRQGEVMDFTITLWEKQGKRPTIGAFSGSNPSSINHSSVKLNQSQLSAVRINADSSGQVRAEISTFTGADSALLNPELDYVIFGDKSGKLERYSVRSGQKMWSATLPAGVGAPDIYAPPNGGNCFYVVCKSGNELVHQDSIWSVPLNGVGIAEEKARFWEGGSESSDVDAGATVAGHIKGSDEFLINYRISDKFVNEGISEAVAKIFEKAQAGQVVQLKINAKDKTLRQSERDSSATQNVEKPTVIEDTNQKYGGRMAVIYQNAGDFAFDYQSNSISIFRNVKNSKTLVRKWSTPSTSVDILDANNAIASFDGNKRMLLKCNNLVRATIGDKSAWLETEAIAKNEPTGKAFVNLENSNVRIHVKVDYSGGVLEITDLRTGKEVKCDGLNKLDDVTYQTKVCACWIGSNEAIICFSNGYFLLKKYDGKWNLERLEHRTIPFAKCISAGEKDGEVIISQQDGLYFAKVSDKDISLEKAVFFGDHYSAFVLLDSFNYAGSARFLDRLSFADSKTTYPFEQFDLRLNRPDIVLERLGAPPEAVTIAKELREKRLKRMAVTDDMLKPDFHLPELQIAGEVPASTSKEQIDLQIKATDDKYPLDRLRVYVNNVPVNGRDGELLRDQKTQSLEKTIPVKLATGRNKIQVSVLNSAGAESLYANADVTCTAERPKPKLYAVAIGVSQYDRPEWCLKYAVKDATDLVNQLKAKAGSAYSEVKPLLLTDKDVTRESAGKIKEFLSGATIDDTVLVFMAGHGILDDKYDYYFGTTDIDPEKPAERGMPYDAIDTILAEVPSLRKALLMDTCHAGELDADEKKELANEEGKGSAPSASDASLSGKVAMRAIGTRGMSVKGIAGGKGKSDWYEKLQDMFVDLRRGSGATVISSSQGAEYAFESSEQSNGLFTYALIEALDGKAEKNKDGQITISAVGDYVKKRVQDLTKGKQNPNLRGVNLEEDFPLASTK
jgi:hypothetical protein